MQVVKDSNSEKIRQARAAIEQAYGYYSPLPFSQPEKDDDRQAYFEYHPAA